MSNDLGRIAGRLARLPDGVELRDGSGGFSSRLPPSMATGARRLFRPAASVPLRWNPSS